MTKTIDDIQVNYELLTKDILQELMPEEVFNSQTKKPQMLEKLDEYLDKDPLLKRRILTKYPKQYCLHPTKVEEKLGITKTERKRWEEQGKLRVVHYDSFSKYGKTFDVPLYNFVDVELATPERIEEWRSAHKQKVTENRKAAAKQASVTKKENDKARNKFLKEEYKQMLLEWQKQSPEMSSTAELGFWLVSVNRWAKAYQEKEFRAVKLKEQHKRRKEELYELKNEIIELLSHSPFVSMSIYVPGQKEGRILSRFDMCNKHYHKWKHKRETMYYFYPKDEFVRDHFEHHIKECNECMAGIEEAIHYYSLVFLEVNDINGERLFSFHTPLPIILSTDAFSHINHLELPKVTHLEQEGMFRFGRSHSDEERIIYTEKVTMQKLEESVQKYKEYLNHWQQAK